MSKLFVDKTIEINASLSKVWEVLTKREYTCQWAPKFNGGSPFYIESDWKSGNPVFWKDADGKVIVEGNVTALEPEKLLRFTVFDVRSEKSPVTEEDGITYLSLRGRAKRYFMLCRAIFPRWLMERNTVTCPLMSGNVSYQK